MAHIWTLAPPKPEDANPSADFADAAMRKRTHTIALNIHTTTLNISVCYQLCASCVLLLRVVRERHTRICGLREYLGGELNSPVAEWLNKGLMSASNPRMRRMSRTSRWV
eukprot:1345983-Pyramimonas_sp.AAC.1